MNYATKHKKEENKRHIAQHNNQVLNIFWKHILDTLQKNNNKLEWNVYFSTLQYSKELLQHFYTGHKLLYSELIEVIDLETGLLHN
jgi:hypothetical protein